MNTQLAPLPSDTPSIFLMGATACGKTSVSIEIAKALNAEIISVDSALVYRGMNIGTAKPDHDERAGVVHHLIDICDPWQSYSAAQFCADANQLIKQIHSRGKRALLVGGTMLYFKALEEGMATLPEADVQTRARLLEEAQLQGWHELHKQLTTIDPMAASRIHPNDPQRIQRALEVYRLTGVPLSELQAQTRSDLQAAPVKFALIPSHRAWLHQRIEQRFKAMMVAGFMDELQHLRAETRLHIDLPSVRSVGYRQGWEFLDHRAVCAAMDEALPTDKEWQEKAVAATRQLAKRQMTWLRSMHNINVIECDTQSMSEQVERILITLDKVN